MKFSPLMLFGFIILTSSAFGKEMECFVQNTYSIKANGQVIAEAVQGQLVSFNKSQDSFEKKYPVPSIESFKLKTDQTSVSSDQSKLLLEHVLNKVVTSNNGAMISFQAPQGGFLSSVGSWKEAKVANYNISSARLNSSDSMGESSRQGGGEGAQSSTASSFIGLAPFNVGAPGEYKYVQAEMTNEIKFDCEKIAKSNPSHVDSDRSPSGKGLWSSKSRPGLSSAVER